MDKLLYLDLSTDMPGADAHRRVSVERCKPCTTPHDLGDMPRCLLGWVDAIRAQQFHKKESPHGTSLRTSCQRPSSGLRWKDQRPPIVPWSGPGHRGDVRDALDWALSTIMGTGDGPAALTTTHLALLGWDSEPAPLKQTAYTVRFAQRELSRANG